jgi:ATP-dependent Clp protease ATP-binding subunit ClpC
MTSNVGSGYLNDQNKIGFSSMSRAENETYSANERMMTELKKTFRPEFLNRIDDIIIFRRLERESVEKIASILLKEFVSRVKDIGISAEIDSGVAEIIAKEGYDEVNGARPIRRTITRLVEDPFVEEMLCGNISEGDSVVIRGENGKILFLKKTF